MNNLWQIMNHTISQLNNKLEILLISLGRYEVTNYGHLNNNNNNNNFDKETTFRI
ncbi:MAG: hypothetical protein AB7U98_03845 [Candidatus Nitrosocosmicus sp.]